MAILGFILLSVMSLLAKPADAKIHQLQELDVDCQRSMLFLQKAVGVAKSNDHTYELDGNCHLNGQYNTGPVLEAQPQVQASAAWTGSTHYYMESVNLISPIVTPQIPDCFGSQISFPPASMTCVANAYHVGTGPEVAAYHCDKDPVINANARCLVMWQKNLTGWQGFSWKPLHNRPLLLGVVSLSDAVESSKHNLPPSPISCNDLELTDATGVLPGVNIHTYKLDGTCELYHSWNTDKGLQVTHVLISGEWNQTARQARESVKVLVPANQGGGSWTTTYTCDEDPWLTWRAKCSKQVRIGKRPSVNMAITDIIDRHPVGLGKVVKYGDQAIKMSKAHWAMLNKISKMQLLLKKSGHEISASKRLPVSRHGLVLLHPRTFSHISKISTTDTKRRFGAAIINKTTAKPRIPTVQQPTANRRNIRVAANLAREMTPQSSASAIPMRGHALENVQPKHIVRTETYRIHSPSSVAPKAIARLRVASFTARLISDCSNLGSIIRFSVSLYNVGARSGLVGITVGETGRSTYFHSKMISPHARIPHRGRHTFVLIAGTQSRYLAKLPGPHRFFVGVRTGPHDVLSPGGQRIAVVNIPAGFCQPARHQMHVIQERPMIRKNKAVLKLNTQPEPPTKSQRFALPVR